MWCVVRILSHDQVAHTDLLLPGHRDSRATVAGGEGRQSEPASRSALPKYAKMSVRLWQWTLGQTVTPADPETTGPLIDTAGVAAPNGVFFLARLLSINSGLGATADRMIAVREGTQFFLPLLTSSRTMSVLSRRSRWPNFTRTSPSPWAGSRTGSHRSPARSLLTRP